jgi:Domain of unknown function (DUF3362)
MQTAVPFDIATCMYHTGIDPFTGQEVVVSKQLRDRKMQRALLQFLEPETYPGTRSVRSRCMGMKTQPRLDRSGGGFRVVEAGDGRVSDRVGRTAGASAGIGRAVSGSAGSGP